ncbi:TIGR03086 family metal-binding protein [Amycolatopsis sp. FDAARGOS 1241]|uniref:TIGR03086 family metal-binding protein n=1 Tax=Amycolatopsis sp. FDAARGOS 1241 TaxID=2778070 RepID=UPI001951AD5F|nr:TIGR03086 family metal-binding protein [Amycolatopsis sp. FDAARGOS 1241]QRP46608.1 TIGR03086 family protein [Amycolatopsis sp. FDAARGOS 1241]
MTDHSALLSPAAAEFLRAAALPTAAARTPCADYDARGLLDHLLYWGPWLAAAGRRESYTADGSEADAALVTGDWPAKLEKQTQDLVDAFTAPGAWHGTVALGSATLPAAVVGDLVLGEFVLHGWDLARAAGATLSCPDETAEAVRASAVAMGGQARSMGVYGPEVAVPADAPPLDRALGASGRDPRWRP